jgi:type III secretion system HrpE/YscL family protein
MARVIKADAAARIVPAAVAGAAEQARALIAAARAEAERIRDAAREEGRAQGRAELAAQLIEHAAAHAQSLAALEAQALEVALLAAKRIVGEALALEPRRIADVARPLVAKLRRATRVALHVHPDDAPALEAALAGLREQTGARAVLRVAADPSVARGGCLVQSDVGALDARVETQLAAIERALKAPPP